MLVKVPKRGIIWACGVPYYLERKNYVSMKRACLYQERYPLTINPFFVMTDTIHP